MTVMPTYERVSLRNLRVFLKLSIPEDQKHILSTSNLKTLWQSVIWAPYSKLFLIRENGCGVGYVYIYCYAKTKKYNVGRLLIDERYQNRGLGRQALLWALDYLYSHGAPRVLLSVHPDNAAARKLYESVGFQYCEGHYWGKEMVMMHRPEQPEDPSVCACQPNDPE